MPKLIARERFFYAGRNVEKGEEFEAEQQDVDILTHSVSPRATVPAPKPQRPAETERQNPTEGRGRRGAYNRRDLRAGD